MAKKVKEKYTMVKGKRLRGRRKKMKETCPECNKSFEITKLREVYLADFPTPFNLIHKCDCGIGKTYYVEDDLYTGNRDDLE